MGSRAFRPWHAATIALALYSVFFFFLLRQEGFDFSALVLAGDTFADPAQVPASLRVHRNSDGYDGQFYYRLALDPFTRQWSEYGIRFDYPTYRQPRIGYPLIVWLLTLGRAAAVPVAMVVVNLAAAAAIAFFAAVLLRDARWGIVAAIYPGFLYSLSRDLAEILEIAFILAAVVALTRRRFTVATLLLTFALLTKETALLFVFAMALAAGVVERRIRLAHVALALVPVAVYGAWKLWIFRVYDAEISLGAGNAFGAPFAAASRFVRSMAAGMNLTAAIALAEVALLVMFGVTVFLLWRRSQASLELKAAALVYLLMVVCLSTVIWEEDVAFMRAGSEFATAAVLVAMASTPAARRIVAGAQLCVWFGVAWKILGRL